MENGCGSATESRIGSASDQVMRIVIGIEGSGGMKCETRQSSTFQFTGQR